MPLHSMTAYGYGEREGEGLTYTCEVRSLNSRFLEVNVRLPRHLLALEVDIINHVKGALRRGKVDVFIDTVRAGGMKDLPGLDVDTTRHYLALAKQANDLVRGAGLGDMAPVRFADLARLDGVLTNEGKRQRGLDAAETHRAGIFSALDSSLAALVQARRKEGDALHRALGELLASVEADRCAVAKMRDQILPQLHKNVLKRIDNVVALLAKAGQPTAGSLSDERLAAEVTMVSDKADIDEELTRLQTHIREFERLMQSEDVAGRKLDFMCQEMHREVNTMSNKLLQTEVAQHTLEMKQTVERIRQQVQNIE